MGGAEGPLEGGAGGPGGRVGGRAVWSEVRQECRLEAGPSDGSAPVQRCEVLRRVLRAGPGGSVEEVQREQETTREPWDGFFGRGGRERVRPEWRHPSAAQEVVVPAERLAQALMVWAIGELPMTGAQGFGAESIRRGGGQEAAPPEYMQPFRRGEKEQGEERGEGPFSRLFEDHK